MPLDNIPFINPIYNTLGIYDVNVRSAFTALIFIVVLNIIFRIIVYSGYQNIYVGYKLQAKPVKKREALNDIKIGFFSRVVKHYCFMNEKGTANISAKDIIEREYAKSRVLLLSFKSADTMIKALESAVLFIGLAFVWFFNTEGAETANVIIVALILFVLVKIVAMLFDYDSVRNKSIFEMSNYIEIEAGQFYTKDFLRAINLMRSELKDILAAQAPQMTDALKKITDSVGVNIKAMIDAAQKSTNDTAELISKTTVGIDESLTKWKEIIAGTSGIQAEFNNVKEITEQLSKNTLALTESNYQAISKSQEISAMVEYIKSNQTALNTTLNEYETTLKGLTTEIGEGLGKIIEYRLQDVMGVVTDNMKTSAEAVSMANNGLISRLTELFDNLKEQSRTEAQAIMSIKEQMEIHNEFNKK